MHQVTPFEHSRIVKPIIRYVAYLILLVAVLGLGWFITPTSVQYHLIEQYVFSSPQHDASVSLAVIVPQSGPYQTVRDIRVQWNGPYEQEPHTSLDVVKFQGVVTSGESQTATISYDLTVRQGSAQWTAPVLDFQVLPQAGIESDQPLLIHQAAQAADGQTRADAYAPYAFTSEYLAWPRGNRVGISSSAMTAYQARVGGCGEFAHLAVALYRAARIPAQAITGLALPAYPPFWSITSIWNHPGGAHAWAEVYTGASWELVDPSWGSAWPGFLKWLWFGRNDGSHLSYGESGQYERLYEDLTTWNEQHGVPVERVSPLSPV